MIRLFPGMIIDMTKKEGINMSTEKINVAKIFGENVFNDTVMQERLPKKVYIKLKKTIEEGREQSKKAPHTIRTGFSR